MTDLYQDDLAADAALSDERAEASYDRPVPCEFICGKAGVGKTYGVMRAVAADKTYGILTATTGIAAVNLGAITVHSTIGYSDTASLQDIYLSGRLTRKLHELALSYRRLIVDEGSMIDAMQLDLWYRGVEDANRYRDVREPLGITIVGDFGQLPPVKARWAFDADCWHRFAANTTRLEKVWRQDTGPFLDALNLARAGLGREAAETLAVAGATFHTSAATEFDGTTILPKNEMVSKYNAMALDRVRGRAFSVSSQRWGQQRKEWGLNPRTHEWGIPPTVPLKVGAYVMILANARDFSVVNGDCGHIVDQDDSGIDVHLIRGDKVVRIEKIVRGVELRDRPEDWPADAPRISKGDDDGTTYLPRPHFRGGVRRYVLGQIEYYPMRLASASTVHKSQGLTLDRVQVDYRDWFFSKPAMVYVAMSRCRSLEGLRMVGMKERFAKACTVDERVRPWL